MVLVSNLLIFISIVLILISTVLFIKFLSLVINWFLSRDTLRIKFRDFKTFYALNSDRWSLYDDAVICNIKGDFESFYFGFIDYCRYRLWKRNIEKKKINKTNMEIIARMLEAVKEDIKKTEN